VTDGWSDGVIDGGYKDLPIAAKIKIMATRIKTVNIATAFVAI
jgi:hypothetical protein